MPKSPWALFPNWSVTNQHLLTAHKSGWIQRPMFSFLLSPFILCVLYSHYLCWCGVPESDVLPSPLRSSASIVSVAFLLPPFAGRPVTGRRVAVQTLPPNAPTIFLSIIIPFQSCVNCFIASALVSPSTIISSVGQYSIFIVLFKILSQV